MKAKELHQNEIILYRTKSGIYQMLQLIDVQPAGHVFKVIAQKKGPLLQDRWEGCTQNKLVTIPHDEEVNPL